MVQQLNQRRQLHVQEALRSDLCATAGDKRINWIAKAGRLAKSIFEKQ
jgi:hypothetical protein